jgi:hypothetical protein
LITPHKRLDEAVFAAYGWKSDLPDEEILERLLALLPPLRKCFAKFGEE